MSEHGLWYEGAPFDDDGHRVSLGRWGGVGGTGRGKCRCGAMSESLPSAYQRKAWHRAHKADVAAAGSLRCNGSTYVSGGKEEYGSDGLDDWSYRIRAQCNGGPGGNCGFDMPVPEEDGDEAWGIDNDDMADLHAKHLAHSRGEDR